MSRTEYRPVPLSKESQVTRAPYQERVPQVITPIMEVKVSTAARALGLSRLITMSCLTCPPILSAQVVARKVMYSNMSSVTSITPSSVVSSRYLRATSVPMASIIRIMPAAAKIARRSVKRSKVVVTFLSIFIPRFLRNPHIPHHEISSNLDARAAHYWVSGGGATQNPIYCAPPTVFSSLQEKGLSDDQSPGLPQQKFSYFGVTLRGGVVLYHLPSDCFNGVNVPLAFLP